MEITIDSVWEVHRLWCWMPFDQEYYKYGYQEEDEEALPSGVRVKNAPNQSNLTATATDFRVTVLVSFNRKPLESINSRP